MASRLGPARVFSALGGGLAPPPVLLLSLKIVTPVLGGGIEGGISDTLITPVRASAIRGSLRWFWRASVGAAFTSAEALSKRESEIWGSTAGRSKVIVEILEAQLAPGVDAIREESGRRIIEQPNYALFPAQSDKKISKIHKSGSFKLRITIKDPTHQKEVEAALKAWIWFGGIGARTRRGLGSLVSADAAFRPANPVVFPGLPKLPATPPLWSMLPGARLIVGPKMATANQAWLEAINLYKSYRQARREGQEHNRPGRSYWHEPDAIRRLRRTSSRRHSEPVSTENIFPRGQFGLPIVFHFKDSNSGDPQDNTLELDADSDRLASPVLVKALVVSETEAYPMILALRTPDAPTKLILKQGKDKRDDQTVDRGGLDVIEGLLQTAELQWKTKRRTLA